jgi:hypothetical protein
VIKDKEKFWVIRFGIVLLIITTLPYLVAYFRQGSNWVFTGFLFGVEDGNSYIAKMLSGSTGAWLFRTPYSEVYQKGFFAFFPYLLLGKLAASPGIHEQLVAIFHLFRWVGGIMMCLATYDFIALFVEEIPLRRLGTALVVAGGGLGWISAVGLGSLWNGRIPLEFYSPETFGFLDIYGLPHLAVGRALLLWGLIIFIKRDQPGWKTGLIWLILGIMQPLTTAISWIITAGYITFSVWLQRIKNMTGEVFSNGLYLKKAIIAGIISAPIVIYTVFSFRTDLYLKVWTKQNLIFSPPIGDYFLAFGIMLPLVFITLVRGLKSEKPENRLALSWSILIIPLIYFPFTMQRRMPEGCWTVIVILAILGFKNSSIVTRKFYRVLLYTSFLPTMFLLMGGMMTAWQPNTPVFRPMKEVEVFNFIQDKLPEGSVVLAKYDSSNALPAWTPARTIIGHGPESADLSAINPKVESFFMELLSSQEKRDLLRSLHIQFVLFPKSSWNNAKASELELKVIFENDQFILTSFNNS